MNCPYLWKSDRPNPWYDLAVAVSHDCDIANENLEAEPAVELVLGCFVDKQNGNYTYGKNPLTLQIRKILMASCHFGSRLIGCFL
jgi:hypothetical protein